MESISKADERVRLSSRETFKVKETSYIYAIDGTCIAQLKEGADSSYLEFNQIPDEIIDAFIAIEDKRFYEHRGVDYLSIVKSSILLLQNNQIVRGGSTITQQLARNVFSDIGFKKSFDRKIQEALTAIFLEKKYSKNLIIEFYVNNINFGNNCIGIVSASRKYFSKEVDDLTVAEVAYLCAIPNNPTLYNPLENNENVVKRRNVIIKELFNQGKIDEMTYLEALNSPVHLSINEQAFFNYETSFALHCASEKIMQSNKFKFKYTFENDKEFENYLSDYKIARDNALHQIYTGGLKIHTSLDLRIQKKAQKIFDENLKNFTEKDKNGIYVQQGAMTIIDNRTGKVLAVIGGRSQDCISNVYSLNRAFQTYRQPGSTIKPLIVYTPMIEKGYNAQSIVNDSKIENGPKNSDDIYDGEITLQTAVEKSKNVVAWRLFEELGPKNGLSYITKMKFDRITANDYYLPAALGGLYYGVTVTQMASGYTTLVNDGVYFEPTCVNSIVNKNGKELIKESKGKRIYDTNAAQEMMYILSGVSKQGTAKGLNLPHSIKTPIVCKTGTSNEQTVAWFCGATPNFTIAVYVGRDDNKSTEDLWGSSYPMEIWRETQDFLYEDDKEEALFSYMNNARYKKLLNLTQKEENEQGSISKQEVKNSTSSSSSLSSSRAQSSTANTSEVKNSIKQESKSLSSNDVDSVKPTIENSIKPTPEIAEAKKEKKDKNSTKKPEANSVEPVESQDTDIKNQEEEEETSESTQNLVKEPIKDSEKPIKDQNVQVEESTEEQKGSENNSEGQLKEIGVPMNNSEIE